MMNKDQELKDLGETAFPVADISKTQCTGMTLRDYFAEGAMRGWLSNHSHYKHPSSAGLGSNIAKLSYDLADDMLRERGRS